MIITVTGGARSGKSRFAEHFFNRDEAICYIATGKALDEEMEARIAAHRQSRPAHWRTFEQQEHLEHALGEEDHYILDDVTNLVGELLYRESQDMRDLSDLVIQQVEEKSVRILDDLLDLALRREKSILLVTNEVGSSIVPENKAARVFRDIQGRVNQHLAHRSDQVYLVCCGIPVKIK
ncbi:MAG: bifunctional adenosylcobinamide kinase/adenosylcobinamide-phosphate guanylyltransferase [Tissierellia bacterium]|nr:bifunctional adenosylcobinamide kinase/adenosylcobinamide-phosphate guanylyltransferase [Tissierellia bacterium]